jgi:predicted metal-dependent phosphoesterase TrpH
MNVDGFCDLHMHSTASDGTDAPQLLAAIALREGVGAIALTDHDTTVGLLAAGEACARAGIAFVPGIELSCDPRVVCAWAAPSGGAPAMSPADSPMISPLPVVPPTRKLGTLHILGLFVRHDDAKLAAIHDRLLDARSERNPMIVDKLRELGIDITYAEVEALARRLGTEIIGRPHIGQVLVEKGVVTDIKDAFTRYIGEGKPAYARKDLLAPGHAIEAIHHAGGLAILAHPVQLKYKDDDELEAIIVSLKSLGLDGVEVHHSDHRAEHVEQYTRLAQCHGLLLSGGSDYHGTRKATMLGSQRVPGAFYGALRDRAQQPI